MQRSLGMRLIPWSTLPALAAILTGPGDASAQAQPGSSLFLSSQAAEPAVDAEAPTFYKEVLPILQENCVVCHQAAAAEDGSGRISGFHSADLVAPMSFETYELTRPWARAIALAVESRRMPPWSAHVQHRGTFKDERYLEDHEIATLVAWADAGAPIGDPALAPPPPPQRRAATGWAIGEPDLVVQVPEPYTIEDNVLDLYVDLHIPLSEDQHPEPRWIKASQLAPGSAAVHHINSPYLGTIAPGRGPNEWPEGFGILLPPGETLVMDMHYHKAGGPGTAVEDRSGGAFVFYEEGEVITHIIETLTTFPGGQDFVIPAGDPNFSHTATLEFDEDTYLLSTAPHMHLRGKASKLELEYPDGTIEVLLYIPDYNFEWQHKYDFAEPALMPAGSKLHLTMWWDNSVDNPHNPDPTRDVPFGLATTDEMMTARIFYARAEPIHHIVGDPIPPELLPSRPRWENSEHGEPKFVEMLESEEETAGH